MHELSPIIQDVTIILVVASVVTLLFQYIRQPVVLGYLVAGIIIGPHTPPYTLVSNIDDVEVIADLGVIFVMFSLGLEFSFHKLTRVGFSAGITGIIEVALIAGLGFVTARLLEWSLYDSLFLGAAISISSTTIIIKSLEELGLKTKRFAELIFGLLIVEDLLAVLILVVLSTAVTTHNISSMEIIWAAVKLIVVVGSWFLIGYFFVPYFFRRLLQQANQETLTIVSMAFCMLLVLIAVYFNYSTALGAFIMGSILAETPQVHRIEELVRPIRDVFAAVFFVSVGILINPKLIFYNLPVVLLVTSVMIIGKILAPSIGALLTGQSFNTALRVGCGMAQIGEFSFIIVGLGMTMHVTSNELYSTVVAVSAVSAFTGPYLIRLSGQLVNQVERRFSPQVKSFLENYSAWVYQALADKKDRSSYRKTIIRFVINAIIVALIFTLTDTFISPYFDNILNVNWLVEVISWLAALALSSPFLWGMLFSFRVEEIPQQTNKNALYLQKGLIWLMTVIEVSFFSIAYFHTWIIGAIVLSIATLFFVLMHSRLAKFYQWFENNLLANIRSPAIKKDQLKRLAPWDSRLVHMNVKKYSPLVGKTFEECQVRQKYGVNVVAMQQEEELLLAPRGNQVLLAGDKLIVLGTDEQLEQFRQIVEMPALSEAKATRMLEGLILKAVFLDQDSSFIGCTIRDSQIREQAKGLVVGLERKDKQNLNPDPATVLEVGDVLLMVGNADLLNGLA